MGIDKRTSKMGDPASIPDAGANIPECVSVVKDLSIAKTCRRVRCLGKIENVSRVGSVVAADDTFVEGRGIPQRRRNLQQHTGEWLAHKQHKMATTRMNKTRKSTPRGLLDELQRSLVGRT